MKVQGEKAYNTFPYIKEGTVFVFMKDGEPYRTYMKTNTSFNCVGEVEYNAVNLETGELKAFKKGESLSRPVFIKDNATVVLY